MEQQHLMAQEPDEDPRAAEEHLARLGPLFRPLSDAEIAKRARMFERAGYLSPETLAFALWELDSPGVLGWDDQGHVPGA
jgi:hypothetical protein